MFTLNHTSPSTSTLIYHRKFSNENLHALTENCLTGSSYNRQITSTESIFVSTSGINFISHYYIATCTSIVTSDMRNITVTSLATITPDRQSLVPVISGICGAIVTVLFLIFFIFLGLVISKKSK